MGWISDTGLVCCPDEISDKADEDGRCSFGVQEDVATCVYDTDLFHFLCERGSEVGCEPYASESD